MMVGGKWVKSTAKLLGEQTKLALKLASESQMSEAGTVIIRELKSGARLASQYGGEATDWVKKSSSSFSKGGRTIETHWYENLTNGLRTEFKTIIDATMKGK